MEGFFHHVHHFLTARGPTLPGCTLAWRPTGAQLNHSPLAPSGVDELAWSCHQGDMVWGVK